MVDLAGEELGSFFLDPFMRQDKEAVFSAEIGRRKIAEWTVLQSLIPQLCLTVRCISQIIALVSCVTDIASMHPY